MKIMHVKVEFVEELLGTSSADPEIQRRFIASKSEDAVKIQEEVDAIGADAVSERAMTVFPRTEDGKPFMWDYQVRGYFKDSFGALRRAPDTVCAKTKDMRAYKKVVDTNIFVSPRKIELVLPEGGAIGDCQRPLRASTPQGERVALARSETVPAGTTCEFDIRLINDALEKPVREALAYGELHGMGQWRNSGKGAFFCEVTSVKKFAGIGLA